MEKLNVLSHVGFRIDQQGHLTDWKGWPALVAAPQSTPTTRGTNHAAFTRDEEELLLRWTSAAKQEGFGGSAMFEQLENLVSPISLDLNGQNRLTFQSPKLPRHPWRSWQSASKTERFLSLPPPRQNFDAPFPPPPLPDLTASVPSSPDAHSSPSSHDVEQPIPEPAPPAVPVAATSLKSTRQPGRVPSNDAALEHPSWNHGLTYRHFRCDEMSNIIRMLNLRTEKRLLEWLAQSWVVEAYTELAASYLDQLRQESLEVLAQGKPLPSYRGSQNERQVSMAVKALREGHAQYLEESADKSNWNADDHIVRFVARLVTSGRAPDGPWTAYTDEASLQPLCEKAHFLMTWLRWIHRPVGGKSTKMMKNKAKKDAKLEFLTRLRNGRGGQVMDDVEASLDTEAPSNLVDSTRELDLTGDVDEDTEDAQSPTAQTLDQDSTDGPLLEQRRSTPGSPALVVVATRNQQSSEVYTFDRDDVTLPLSRTGGHIQGASWLGDQARTVWLNRCETMMNGWGVSIDHVGTCVLVPQAWKNIQPHSLRDRFGMDQVPESEPREARLTITIGELTRPWARCAAWFQIWPRSGTELDSFLAVVAQGAGMHGSHLCHHGLCVNPNHVVYEHAKTNLSRLSCAAFARNIRRYAGVYALISQCRLHQPPCMMQHAALTTAESMYIQFSILSRARGLPSPFPPELPAGHPYQTFEHDLPLQLDTQGGSAVDLDPAHLVQPAPPNAVRSRSRLYSFGCPFCQRVQSWRVIDGFWSHLKLCHDEVPHDARLTEVKRQTAEYLALIRERNKEGAYRSANPAQWNKMQQTQAPGFNWQTFTTWNFRSDANNRLFTG